jgi:uncharacterized protein (DUF1697 family)
MPRYVAFLRAINVGGHTVKMDRLRRLFQALEFSNVETFIASGNVIFDAPARSATSLEPKIETALHDALGYRVATFVRTPSFLTEIVRNTPFSEADGCSLYIGFLAGTPTAGARRKLLSFQSEVDELHIAGREVYWLCRKSFSESAFSGALLERTLGLEATLRNANTIRRIASKYARAA